MVVNNGSYVAGAEATVNKDWVDLIDGKTHQALQSDALIGKYNFCIEASGISTSVITSGNDAVVCCSRVEKDSGGYERNIQALSYDGKVYHSGTFGEINPTTGTITMPSGTMFAGSYYVYAW